MFFRATLDDIDSHRDLSFNASMRRGWKTWVLVLAMFAIYWILVMPQVDLDPATPLNLEVLFFAVIALSVLLGSNEAGNSPQGKFSDDLDPVAPAPPSLLVARIAELRV